VARAAGNPSSDEHDPVAAADGPAIDDRGVDADVHSVVLSGRPEDPESLGRSPCGSVIITQRGHGSVMARRTVSPLTTVRPIQSFSTKPGSSLPVDTTMLEATLRIQLP
jgi:hypothetical protein